MLDKEHTIVQASETNVYDVMIKLLECRHFLAERYSFITGEAQLAKTKEQLERLDEHFFDLKLIATDNYDPEEEA